jgi:hypothetical protein
MDPTRLHKLGVQAKGLFAPGLPRCRPSQRIPPFRWTLTAGKLDAVGEDRQGASEKASYVAIATQEPKR